MVVTRSRFGTCFASIGLLLLTGCAGATPPPDAPIAANDSAGTATTVRADVDPCPSTVTAQPGAGSPAPSAAAVDAGTPQAPRLPEGTLACLGPGSGLSWTALEGQPLVVNLWASWCAPCREEMPILQAAYRAQPPPPPGGPPEIQFIGVDVRDEPAAAADLLAALDVRYPQLQDPQGLMMDEMALPGLPVTIAVDAGGNVADIQIGQLDTARLQELLEAARGTGG